MIIIPLKNYEENNAALVTMQKIVMAKKLMNYAVWIIMHWDYCQRRWGMGVIKDLEREG